MLTLRFSGWFQCRLATDPDPSDERRGISGFTCAVADEPDLDRVVRLQPQGAHRRRFGPEIGVAVRQVLLHGKVIDHALVGMPVDLLAVESIGPPTFEGRNGLAFEDEGEPIYPFVIRIGDDDLALEAQHRDSVSGEWLVTVPHRVERDSLAVRQAAGFSTAQDYTSHRIAELENWLHELTSSRAVEQADTKCSPTRQIVGVQMRIKHLKWLAAGPLIDMFMSFAMHYRIVLECHSYLSTKGLPLGIKPSLYPWLCNFWVGAWDHDALCGFMEGALEIPVAKVTAS